MVLNLNAVLMSVLLPTSNQIQVMRRNKVGYEVGEEGRNQRARDAHLLSPDLQSPSPVSSSMCQNMYVCILKSITAINLIKPLLNSWTCLNDGWIAALDLVKKLVNHSRLDIMATMSLSVSIRSSLDLLNS